MHRLVSLMMILYWCCLLIVASDGGGSDRNDGDRCICHYCQQTLCPTCRWPPFVWSACYAWWSRLMSKPMLAHRYYSPSFSQLFTNRKMKKTCLLFINDYSFSPLLVNMKCKKGNILPNCMHCFFLFLLLFVLPPPNIENRSCCSVVVDDVDVNEHNFSNGIQSTICCRACSHDWLLQSDWLCSIDWYLLMLDE